MTGGDLLAAVDGGGTSTRVLLGRADGTLLGEGRGPSGNLHDVGREGLERNVREALDGALAAAGLGEARATRVFCGMASVGTAPERALVAEVVEAIGLAPRDRVDVATDIVAAHSAALAGAPGVALIAGTGSSCLGRDAEGRMHQVGGWGSLLDDVGGATWIGTQAMVAAVRAFDGRGEPTALTDAVMDHFGLAHLRELLVVVDANPLPRGARADLSPLVTEAAADGDPVACGVLARGAEALAECVAAAARVLGLGGDGVPVAATGGLVENVPVYRTLIHEAVERALPTARCQEPATTNVRGAFLEALRAHHGAIPDGARQRVLAG